MYSKNVIQFIIMEWNLILCFWFGFLWNGIESAVGLVPTPGSGLCRCCVSAWALVMLLVFGSAFPGGPPAERGRGTLAWGGGRGTVTPGHTAMPL